MIGSLITVTSETDEINRFTIKLAEPFFSFKAGQYIMVSFPDTPEEKRAYSVVTYDKERKEILLAIKKTGLFTQKLFSAKPGQLFNVLGPYGTFTLTDEATPKIFIAGGIGITPLYSMLKHIHNSDCTSRLYLYYSGKSKKKMAFLKELQQNKDERINVNFVYTEENKKRITANEIQIVVPEFRESQFYICGPIMMIENIRKELINMNIPEEVIKSEEFT